MNRARDFLLLTGFGFLLSVTGCGSPNEDSPASAPADAGLEASQDAPGDVYLDQVAEVSAEAGDARDEADSPAGPVVVSVYSTSDEHGWLQPWTSAGSKYGGAANVFAAMTGKGGFDTAKDVLVSAGDNWTGAAITTVFQGKPMVDVFNYMGYAATAIGNHEFDFGVGILKERIAESNYAYLGANLRDKGTDQQVEFALPYVIVQRQGIDIGLIGITTPATATATNPKNVADIDFAPVVESLNIVIPEVRAQGAEMVLVVAHHDAFSMQSVAQQLTEPPDGIFTGHDHANLHLVVDGIPLVGSGYNMEGFAITRFQYDPEAQVTTFLDSTFQTVKHPASNTLALPKDQGLADLIDSWQTQLDVLLGEEIGYTATGIQLGWPIGNWVTDAWLWAYPEADVAMTNFGGLRVPIPAGAVRLQNIFDVMPFENTIFELELTGEQLREDLVVASNQCGFFGGCSLAIGGIRTTGSGSALSVTLADGTPIDPGGVYRVLVNDYMYEAGPYPLKAQDPTPVEMGANYRDPVVDWTRQLDTSPSNPLEGHIDKESRAK
jgi:2',3'-cyclic-nucleotide 2'-phosphodiesterase/3'-nucleotidase